jgi:hypothetical protein
MDIIFLLSLASGIIVVICIVALFKQRTVKGIVITLNQHSDRLITIKSQSKVKESHNTQEYWGHVCEIGPQEAMFILAGERKISI